MENEKDYLFDQLSLSSKVEQRKQKMQMAKNLRTMKEALYLFGLISNEDKIKTITLEEGLKSIKDFITSEDFTSQNIKMTISQVAQCANTTRSTVQRDLSEQLQEIDHEIYEIVAEIMKNNYNKRGRSGGEAFARNNIGLKDKNGRFIGSRKK